MGAMLPGPADLEDDERAAVEAFLYTLADDEYVLADRYTDWQVNGPTLEADISIANIAQDELGHARLWYDLLMDFGYDEPALIWDRPADDFRHSPLVERAFGSGDWADCMLRSYLYDVYEYLLLEALTETRYPRIADRVGKVRSEESYHREFSQNWLEELCESPGGRERVQGALDRLFADALTLFVPTDHEAAIVELGVRPVGLDQLRDDWFAIVGPYLEGLGLTLPLAPDDDPDGLLPEVVGRDGTHTDDWHRQYNEMTYTYRMLGRTEARRLMADPDEAT